MSDCTHTKRRRGAQPGNQNAKGNCGNPRPRPNLGNRGGRGAPEGNQYARAKSRTLAHVLLDEYRHVDEARAWLEANSERLREFSAGGGGTDPVDIAMFSGPPLEDIAEKGLEMAFGLFSPAEFEGPAPAAGERAESLLAA